MTQINWTDSLSVGIDRIDFQHKKLIHMINELNDASMANQGQAITEKMLNELVHYMATHFFEEEALFEKYGYKNAEAHKKAHLIFVDKIYQFKNDNQQTDWDISAELVSFLSDWFFRHIMITDMQYVDFFSERGVH